MMGRLHCDLFHQDRYLLNKTDIKLKLIRSPESFHLITAAGGADVKTVIEAASLWVRTVKVNPNITNGINKALSSGEHIKYPIRRSVVTSFTIPRGQMNISKGNVTSGQLPRRVVVGLVSNTSFNSSITENPFQFKHYNLNKLQLMVGDRLYPSTPLTPNYGGNEFLRCYMTLFEGTGMLNDDRGHCISRADYPKGYTLYCFDLTADMADGGHVDPIKHGDLRMDLHFNVALPETVNAVVYSEYDNVIQLDMSRNVITDF